MDICQVYRVYLSLIPRPPKFSRGIFDYYVLLRTLTAGFFLLSTASVHNVYLIVRNLIIVVSDIYSVTLYRNNNRNLE